MDHEVIIVGAGAAGLSCAAALQKQGIEPLILEARPRPFGRVMTIRPSTIPVELGAEFIHGAPDELIKAAELANVPIMDVFDNHLVKQNGQFTSAHDFFEHIERNLPKKPVIKDQTVREWLRRKSISPTWKKLFRNFIEGFHAADTDLMSRNALVASASEESKGLNGSFMFRVPFGYDQLLQALTKKLDPSRIYFNSVVTKISWRKGFVRVSLKSGNQEHSLTSRKVVVTIPVGCLKRKTILFEPQLEEMEKKFKSVEMGHVQRLVFRFKNRFWETLSTGSPPSFFHLTSDAAFPTWWTGSPIRSNYLVGWCGGPQAKKMSAWPKDKIIFQALVSLSEVSGLSMMYFEKNLLDAYYHDWSNDPFSFGAYSYICQNGLDDVKSMSLPAEKTIYFAGEGLRTDSSQGTVHGAIRSGRNAASLILNQWPAPTLYHRLKNSRLYTKSDVL